MMAAVRIQRSIENSLVYFEVAAVAIVRSFSDPQNRHVTNNFSYETKVSGTMGT